MDYENISSSNSSSGGGGGDGGGNLELEFRAVRSMVMEASSWTCESSVMSDSNSTLSEFCAEIIDGKNSKKTKRRIAKSQHTDY